MNVNKEMSLKTTVSTNIPNEDLNSTVCSSSDEDKFLDEEFSDVEFSFEEEDYPIRTYSRHSKKMILILILSALCISWSYSKTNEFNGLKELVLVKASDSRFTYGGRWLTSTDYGSQQTKKADWPCSDVRFDVNVDKEGASLPIIWYGLRSRLRVTVTTPGKPNDVVFQTIFQGPSFFNDRLISSMIFPEIGRFTVSVRKISSSSPYGTGIGKTILGGSMIHFIGLGKGENLSVLKSTPKERSIVAIGASDTAGWCADGTPSQSSFDYISSGWMYEDCGVTYSSKLASKFDADLSVQAIAGIGMGQNAASKQQWQLGSLTMPDYFRRTLRSIPNEWDFSNNNPDIVLVSLGGNDFNHQDGNEPSSAKFTSQYEDFLSFLFHSYETPANSLSSQKETNIVSICGMGDPFEADRDPDNNRCKPCEHVSASVRSFKASHPEFADRLHYIDIPCDGSVVQGTNDIGCDGHKNSIGQQRIANYLSPKLSLIAGWD